MAGYNPFGGGPRPGGFNGNQYGGAYGRPSFGGPSGYSPMGGHGFGGPQPPQPPQTGGPLPPYTGMPPMGDPSTGGPLPPYQPPAERPGTYGVDPSQMPHMYPGYGRGNDAGQPGPTSSMSYGGGPRPTGFLGNPMPMPRGGFRGY